MRISRAKMIERIIAAAPVILAISETADMGDEFFAVVPTGVIYPEPGMLLNSFSGELPFTQSELLDMLKRPPNSNLNSFLLGNDWSVTAWEILDDVMIEDVFSTMLSFDLI
jgi:hypothetical protein